MTEDESDELPEGWAVAQLGVLGSWFGGGTPTTGVAAYWENGRIPWVSAKDMKADYLESSLIGITERGREAARLTLLPPGAVLMVVRGMILARKFPVAVSAAHLTINQDLRALVPRDEIDPNYLLYTLQLASSEVVQATGEATHGTRRLESDRIKSWPVRIAPLVEQRRIVSAIKGVLAKVSSARERLERVTTTMKRFRQAVLAAACS
jgi:type I restriction enzyme, S subunit